MKKLLALLVIVNLIAFIALITINNMTPEDPYASIPNPIATITLDDGSVMRAELYLQAAPNTVSNFVVLANSGFYDGMAFHRIVNNAFVQVGDPTGLGQGGTDYTIYGEFAENMVNNPIRHERGVLSMARDLSDNNSASSQFFILQGYYSQYDGRYAAFGKLMDDESYVALDALGATPTDKNRKPLRERKIKTIRVETFDYDYKVRKIEPKE